MDTNRFIVSPNPQGTEAWLNDRAGNVNGSEVAAIFAKIKTGEAAARRDLRLKLVLERMTGKAAPQGFVSTDMQWGIDHEPEARVKFETATGLLVEEMGYCTLKGLRVGCSIDGRFVDNDGKSGITEFKCPKSNTHLGYLDAGCLPDDYVPQVTHNLWVTGAEYCYFQSYDPRFPKSMQEFRVLVRRQQLDIKGHEAAVLQFLMEVDHDEKKLRAKYGIH